MAKMTVAPPVTMSPPAKTPTFDVRPVCGSAMSVPHVVCSMSGAVLWISGFGVLPMATTATSSGMSPFQFPEKLIPLIFNNALNGKDLPVYGDGKNVRDWLYVEDHCRAILRVLQAGEVGETYNIGGNSEMQNIEVVQTICDILYEKVDPLPSGEPRRSLIKFVKDRAGHDRRYAIDAGKIKEELGWEPSVKFEDGIRATIEWYLTHDKWVIGVVDGSYRDYYDNMYGNR